MCLWEVVALLVMHVHTSPLPSIHYYSLIAKFHFIYVYIYICVCVCVCVCVGVVFAALQQPL